MKHKINNKSKSKKKWGKGHSSDSNPQTRSHRELAKNKFFNVQSGHSNLTVEALAKHDGNEQSDNEMETLSDVVSIGGHSAKTYNTWASSWTDCTNATFSKIHKNWSANSTAYHKETMAVLAAVTEVIKSEGGTETETTYFAALMTSLETIDNELTLSAALYLLSLAIKRVPASVLKNRFSEVSKKLSDLLVEHSQTEMPMLLRQLLVCLAHLLRVQDSGVWSYSSTTQLYSTILTFTTHAKPKVRKAATEAVRVVLKASNYMTSPDTSGPEHHPAAAITAKYCVQQMESSGGGSDSTVTLHVIGLLHHVLGVFPLKSLKMTCETLFKVMTLANLMVNSTALRCMHNMFVSSPKESSLSAELNAQIITALYDYEPSRRDSQLMTAWLAVMEKAHINLYRLNPELCLVHVSKLFDVCMQCLQKNNPQLCLIAAKTAKCLLKECVEDSVEYLHHQLVKSGQASCVHKMFKSAEMGLSYQYHASWDHVLHILTKFFEVAGNKCSSIMKKSLVSMADLRDSHRFTYQRDLDAAIGMAVRRMGPRVVLSAIPLQITGEDDNPDFPRSWLLPVMRDSIRDTELAYFASYFLPLASKLRTKAMEHANKKEDVQARTYDALQLQIWSLLPGFCTNPTDFCQSFKEIARYLGMALADRPDLQHDVMLSLRKLLHQNDITDEMKVELGRFAKNFLPILFNLFCKEPDNEQDKQRNAYLETVSAYVPVAEQQLIDSYFDRCFARLNENDTTGFKQYAYLDLLIAMIAYINTHKLSLLYQWIIKNLKTKDLTLQKKCYKALKEICATKSDNSKLFVQQNLSDMQEHLVKSLSSTIDSAKAFRLGCLIHIFKQLEHEQKDFIVAVIPEAVLCMKAKNIRARKSAIELITEMANTVVRWAGADSDVSALDEYVTMILAGLDDKQMVPCVVVALTELVNEMRGSLSSHIMDVIVGRGCELLASSSRDIAQPCFDLIRRMLSCMQDTEFAPHLNSLISSLVEMKADNKRHFRKAMKTMFEKLVKKFGYKVIFNLVPEAHHKQLNNIRKTTERLKRKKREQTPASSGGGYQDNDDDVTTIAAPKVESIEDLLQDSDDDDNKSKNKKSNAPHSKKAWLHEAGGEDIVDFLDSSVSKKVLGTKPGAQGAAAQNKVKHDFKTSSDGRLIIGDDNDTDSDDDKKKKPTKKAALKRKLVINDDEDDLNDLLDALSGEHLKNKKKKVVNDNLNDDMETKSQVSGTNYQPGGHGIHRPLTDVEQPEKPFKAQRAGSEYRAKKAGGDIKKTGKPDPYAYIPLEMNLLNKRKRAKASGQFKSLIKGAKKGASKGKKQRTKARR